jgi:hypothetical protein
MGYEIASNAVKRHCIGHKTILNRDQSCMTPVE